MKEDKFFSINKPSIPTLHGKGAIRIGAWVIFKPSNDMENTTKFAFFMCEDGRTRSFKYDEVKDITSQTEKEKANESH